MATRAPYRGSLSDAGVDEVFAILAKGIVPKTELKYGSPFQLLAAVMLSAHTTDKSVNAATAKLFPVAPTAAKMAALGAAGIMPYIRGVGLANTKAPRLAELSRLLVERHGGEVPEDREALEALPGVGRKTANVVLNIVFRHPTIAVDTHIFRVANRLGIAKAKTPEQVEECLLVRVPEEHRLEAHHYLILHGRYTCVARAPKCPTCPVRTQCKFTPKTKALDA